MYSAEPVLDPSGEGGAHGRDVQHRVQKLVDSKQTVWALLLYVMAKESVPVPEGFHVEATHHLTCVTL